ncbi:histidine kinase [Sinorhizobium fredii USDA 205]|uniref:phosphate regulon sensor histidine kinase PhoR n=1 Tax=Rhizobium fredii TaxID=380 RepID=UPI0004BCAC34|nr:phosphate regulon sensor histidine kinase PhoR [Sinorhizobium fredii]ASY67587.1 Phosphate regulon sensor protein PhoR (SphS) [Sinorhizobium fredii CCBAU 83666]AWM23471.1 Phosphate regulon sensor protein PhoR (SphS) [Sinorhizobium fredii CCBAU 25509]KSV92596.1 histidine kinase [Sinorhizobium fredii USDA 205]GEC34136.1 two-component sensor histidine kinase [Sinorhizobium fredii]GLS09253.1 two-component sensor histidine kinase [Sinorhizobium fredii]
MESEGIVLDGAKVFWQGLKPKLKAERGILGLSIVLAVLAALAGIHILAVLPFWIVLVAALLKRSIPSAEPMPEAAPRVTETRTDSLIPVLNALDMPVLVIAADETVLFQNTAAEKVFGTIPPESYLSARVRSPGILDMVRETIATGKVNQIEHSERLPSDAVYVVRVAPADIGGDVQSGRVFLLTYRDISQTRRIDRMRSDFVANASHELRTPLASLRGFIETLEGPAKNDTKAQQKFFGIMHEQVTRMSRLVDDLLSLSRLELKSHIAPEDSVDLVPLLGHVRDSLQPLASDLDVTISLDVPEEPVFVQGDRDELIEVFENLIENACKYGQEGKKVDVRLTGKGGQAEATVSDYGPGIPAEHVPRITERFYRVNVEASRSKKGTGLGLAIVKHILTRHRARLLIHSEVGKGTVFTVRF